MSSSPIKSLAACILFMPLVVRWLAAVDSLNVTDNFYNTSFQYMCSNTTGLSLMVHGVYKQCDPAGNVLHISQATASWLHQGTIVCPPCRKVCEVSINSNCAPEFVVISERRYMWSSYLWITAEGIQQPDILSAAVSSIPSACVRYESLSQRQQ